MLLHNYTEIVEHLPHRSQSPLVILWLANLPFKKTLADFDFNFQPSLDERQIRELATLGFVHQAANVLLPFGRRAWARPTWPWPWTDGPGAGLSVYSTSAHHMIQDLAAAHQENRLHAVVLRGLNS